MLDPRCPPRRAARRARSDDPRRPPAGLRSVFERLHKTVLLVTHDIGEAAAIGDEIALMRGGRVVQRGSFRDLLDRPADPFVTAHGVQRPPAWAS